MSVGLRRRRAPGQSRLKRSYSHVTLARAKSPEGENSIRRELRENILQEVDKEGVIFVYNMTLMQSELRPEESVYTLMDSFALAAS